MLSDDISTFINEINEEPMCYSMNEVIKKLNGFYSEACNLEDEIEQLSNESEDSEETKPFNLKEFLKEHLEPKEFKCDENNYFLYWSSRMEEFDFSYASFYESMDPYFKRDNMQIVVDTLNGENVTLEDLKQAYKELGWI